MADETTPSPQAEPRGGVTPQITLIVNILDMNGAELGSATAPAYLRIALCGFGPVIPRVQGTGIIGKVATWPGDIPYTGAFFSIGLWGNDVITPTGTYYCISILDTNKNVIQSGIYTFVGTATYDLSTAIPTTPSAGWVNSFGIIVLSYFSTLVMPGAGSQLAMYQITLTGDVTVTSFANLTPGIVIFEIAQDGVGTHKWTWPTIVKGGGIINPVPNSTSTQIFFYDGNFLRPLGSMVYS